MASVYDVSAQPAPINWAPATRTEEILQNVGFILSTVAGRVPLARSLGISGDAVDAPMTKARALLQTSVLRAIARYEPRARVGAIYVDEVDTSGRIVPRVKIEI